MCGNFCIQENAQIIADEEDEIIDKPDALPPGVTEDDVALFKDAQSKAQEVGLHCSCLCMAALFQCLFF